MSALLSRWNRWISGTCLALAGLVVLAVALRLAASNTLLWLDEIWSLEFASQASSPLAILTQIKHDNNHFLNTFFLYLTGPERPWIIYRIPAVIAGVLSVIVAGRIGARRGRVEGMTAVALFTTSFLLIHYSSEARGYAFVVLFALASYDTLTNYLERDDLRWGAAFAAVCCFGLLSHPTFTHCYVAAVYWSACSLFLRRLTWKEITRRLAVLHVLPVLLGAALYVVNLRHIKLGGGPEYVLYDKLVEIGSLSLGGPLGGPFALVVCLAFVAGALGGLYLLRREGADEWRFFALATAVPVLLAITARPPFLFARYFLISVVFGLMLWSFLLGRLFGRNRWAYAVVLLLFVAGNTTHTLGLTRIGRGQYLEALQYMARNDAARIITISSDHNFGNRKLIEFYAQFLTPSRQIRYVDVGRWRNLRPGWLIIHRYRKWSDDPPEPDYNILGARYVLDRTFECAPLSGWRWLCYRRQ
jgi:hypothetical protein